MPGADGKLAKDPGLLPRSLRGFLLNQFREHAGRTAGTAGSDNLHACGGPVQLAADYHTRRSAPGAKIRGLLFRDVDPSGRTTLVTRRNLNTLITPCLRILSKRVIGAKEASGDK